ncbi:MULTISPECIES: PAS domain-containing protein [unclassified Nodularia (in: cyanobacteria)]|uniref:PAS domain-containing protein n=1 Tax=unclassified Nodularia (in: cyanobacteria) TaxID=2656917 RepID=UPI00187E0D3E|nr:MULTISPECIES: PAS domain-containing protein [unclassified Nodularia (in: cyanobacteria)]MBE9201233.1 PAS domain-containing protein [Nodularia sp. LEGE 06071]MCC2695367.1 PAS domain-containing protein [Nodularia sp. LEGE 04288]
MNLETFVQQVKLLHGRLANLCQYETAALQPGSDLLTELAMGAQMLEIATEKLYQQTQKLAIAQARVRTEFQRYQDLFEFMPSAYLVTDTQGKIAEANRAASKLFNLQQPFLVNKLLVCFISVEDRQKFRLKFSELGKSEFKYVQEWRFRIQPRHSQPFDAALTVAPLCDVKGNFIAWRWLLRDITEDKSNKHDSKQAGIASAKHTSSINLTPT